MKLHPTPQVTNPAIDPFREAVVTSLRCFVGPEKDLTGQPGGSHCARLELPQPVLSISEMEALKNVDYPGGWKTKVRSVCVCVGRGEGSVLLVVALCARARRSDWGRLQNAAAATIVLMYTLLVPFVTLL